MEAARTVQPRTGGGKSGMHRGTEQSGMNAYLTTATVAKTTHLELIEAPQVNTQGWDEELSHLSDYLAADAKVA
jgi:hypothetical protein